MHDDGLPSSNPAPVRTFGPATTISIIIPCFNEQEVLPLLFDSLQAAGQTWTVPYEVILIDDGSRDRTWEIMQQLHARDPRWKMISLARNFGHQIALWTGLRAATGEIIVVLDADLQDPPEILNRFFEKWRQGYDVVYGVRENRRESRFKRTMYFLFYRILSFLADVEIPLDSGDFCLMDRKVVRVITASSERSPFIRGLRAWAGFRQAAVHYDRPARAAGEVKYTFRKMVHLALDGIFSFSTHPLRLASYAGAFVSFFSFLGVLFTLAQRIFKETFTRWGWPPPPGFATTVVAILFIGGVQLLCLGILGEYVGRIFENVKGRPPSVVDQTLGVADPNRRD